MKARSLTLGSLLVALGAAAYADYKDTYKKGLESVQRGNWAEAARQMRAAAAEQPKEGEQVKLYGMRFEAYLPHYHLGLALFNAGDCEGALEAWQTSETQGAVRKASQYKDLVKNKGTCQTRLAAARAAKPSGPDPAAVAQARQAAESEIARAQQAAERVGALARDPDLAPDWPGDAALGGAQQRAADLVASARGKLDTGTRKPDLQLLAEARDLAAQAQRQFDSLAQEAGTRRQARARERERPLATPAAAAQPKPPRAQGPPVELVRAAQAYFAGDYPRAVSLLVVLDDSKGRSAVQVRLLRAAARHALFLIGGGTDESLRRNALADVRACRSLEPSFVPDARAFSPRFRRFYETGR